ncbi:MAG: hypothetical protein K1X35_04105 [Caulobacteraceae bacterium]|nr:hypothetical protein [Caulobacteraceae bacterium]
MAFSPTEAAFEGFRLTREKPRIIGWWTLLALVLQLGLGVIIAATAGPEFQQLQTFLNDPVNNADIAESLGPKMVLFEAAALPLVLVISAIFACAAYRSVLDPAQSRFGYLRIGRDEGRMLLLYLLLLAIFMGAMFGAILLAGLVMGLLMSSGSAAMGAVGGFGAFLVLGAVLVFFGVRLSLAGPMTFAVGKVLVAPAWKMTRGRFWSLLVAYVLSWIMAFVVQLLGGAIFTAVAMAATGNLGAYQKAGAMEFSSIAEVFTPEHLLFAVSAAVLAALQNAIVLTPSAVAYRALASEEPRADTFD